MIDSRKIEDLHPTLQRGAVELIKRMKTKGLSVEICSTYRDTHRQNELYNKIPKVTTVRGGDSFHNWRLAFDIFETVHGWENDSFFRAAGQIWKGMGGVWGGDFKGFYDSGHMEFSNSLTTAKLKSGLTLPNDFKMKWEIVTVSTPIIKPTLKKGSTGDFVKELQTKLKIPSDGIFGTQTDLAVINFQKKNNLEVDGIVGAKTWAKLN